MLTCQHISANCNPMPNALTFLNKNTIAFCFRDQVGLYNLDQNRITINLNYRQVQINRANCLCCPNQNTIIVGYDSGHLIIYTKIGDQNWKAVEVVKQNAAIGMIYCEGNTLITNNFKAEVIFYNIDFNQQKMLTQIDILKFALNKIMQSIVQIDHKGTKLIFMGGIDQKIYCYSRAPNQPLAYNFQLSGHENSITKLSLTKDANDIILASSSKDGYIRLWRITQNNEIIKFHKNVKKIGQYFCFLDAVLINHQCSVTSLKWVQFGNKLQLVSCSLDCTICVWSVQGEEGGVWTVEARMGQFLGNKNAYFCVQCDSDYQYLVAINYIGSALIWSYNKETKKFMLRPSFNGHTNQVKDIDWDHTGNFLVSVSKDQTTRIISKSKTDGYFHQISRAQVHGYDINAVSLVKINQGMIDLIACGADQKVIRIVEPPACFANYLNYFTKANLHLYFPTAQDEKKYIKSKPDSQVLQYETYAEGGTQVLGLMTKVQRVEREKISSYYDDEEQQAEEQDQKTEDQLQTKINFTLPPHDDYLVKHTLWPEMNKLYGHPHQISALAKNNKRHLLASSCQGKTKVFCTIIIWDTKNWNILKTIQHHHYTVYSMNFSKCGKYFASVSKDRRLAVFDENFQPLFSNQCHARAITCVSFCPNSVYVVTGSRDKTAQVHSIQDKAKVCSFDLKKQVYSVTFCGADVIAVGCIDGTLMLLSFKENQLTELYTVQDKYGHTKAVTKLRYSSGLLASCSEDHSVRVFGFNGKKQQQK